MVPIVPLLAAAALLVVPTMALSATTTTLDFSGNICGLDGTVACGNGGQISQNYGDVTGLDVVWDADASTATPNVIFHWGAGYSTLGNVGYALLGGGGMLISFLPAAGFEVALSSFDIAAYALRQRTSQVTVTDLNGNVSLLNTGSFVVDNVNVTSYTLTERWSTAGITLLLGPDAWDIGISNITYSVRTATGGGNPDPGPSPVPLPPSALLLLAGLGSLAAMRRRRS